MEHQLDITLSADTDTIPAVMGTRYRTTKDDKAPGLLYITPDNYISNTVGIVPSYVELSQVANIPGVTPKTAARPGHFEIHIHAAVLFSVGDHVMVNLELDQILDGQRTMVGGGEKLQGMYQAAAITGTHVNQVVLKPSLHLDNFSYRISFGGNPNEVSESLWPSETATTHAAATAMTTLNALDPTVPYHYGLTVQDDIGDPIIDREFYARPFGVFPFTLQDTYLSPTGKFQYLVYWSRFAGSYNETTGEYQNEIADYYVGNKGLAGQDIMAYSPDRAASDIDPSNYVNVNARKKSILFARAFKAYMTAIGADAGVNKLDQWLLDLHRLYHRQEFWLVSPAEYVHGVSPFPSLQQFTGHGLDVSIRPNGSEPLEPGHYLHDRADGATEEVVLVAEHGEVTAPIPQSGHLHNPAEIHADWLRMSHTAFQAAPHVDVIAVSVLAVRGLAIELNGLTARLLPSRRAGGLEERRRNPHFHIAIDSGRRTTVAERHSIGMEESRIPHDMEYFLTYADTGTPLSDADCALIGRLQLIFEYKGTNISFIS